MSVRVADWSVASHAGRVRRTNEDAYFAEPPLFVVADGMGGALAGEIASRLTVQAFDEFASSQGTPPDEQLGETIRQANRRIMEYAANDSSAAGMGSTVTAIVLDGAELVLGHVGDSRAYVLRDGALRQLTSDHSLVAEMVRAGAIRADEAAAHPQRSVITRALGAGWQVEVDLERFELAAGDTVLLCTDGLSAFVSEAEIVERLSAGSLDDATRLLVDAANAAGGEDNVTVVALRLEASTDGGGDGRALPLHETTSDTGEHELPPRLDPVVHVASDEPPPAYRPPDADEGRWTPRSSEPVISVAPVVSDFGSGPPRRRGSRARRRIAALIAIGALMGAVLLISLILLQWAHFVGNDPESGKVTVFQGVPVELGGGVNLYHAVEKSSVDSASLPQARREQLFGHHLVSEKDARAELAKLQSSEP